MTEQDADRIGASYATIGEELVRLVGDNPSQIVLYVEAGPAWCDAAIFKDEAGSLAFVWPGSEFPLVVLRTWEAEAPGKRWAAMEYVLENGRFTTSFVFPDEIDPNEDAMDRREVMLKRRFGDRPVYYPPI